MVGQSTLLSIPLTDNLVPGRYDPAAQKRTRQAFSVTQLQINVPVANTAVEPDTQIYTPRSGQ